MDAPVLFVIDDEPGMLALIDRAVSSTGYRTVVHDNPGEALAMLAHERADAALVDLRMPQVGGLDVLRAIHQVRPGCGVILMNGHASVDTAIEAVKLGALDYLAEPVDFDRLRQLLAEARDDAARRAELFASENTTAKRLELCGLIGRSAVMQQLFGLVRRIAPHARTVLITGEAGAGKEGIAHAIHDLGPRSTRPFVTVNCSTVSETPGAFTVATDAISGLLEAAGGGTLFLNDVAELPPGVQARLLRVLETGEIQRVGSLQPNQVDVCIVAATNRDLRAEAEAGRFLSALYNRLNVVELHVPPLRERREDIPYLTAAFVEEFAARFSKPIGGVSPAAEQILMSGAWLGNVRELRNVLERACMVVEGNVLTERDVDGVMPAVREARGAVHAAPVPSVAQDLEQVERDHIARVLADVKGNKQAAARRLGISRRTLYRRLQRHGVLQSRDK